MTVGEKIQFYRKKIGLSQEELGQKMHVSRQTISLWEMDKTLPTIDNLLRLKEIFSVSVDDILSEAEPIENKTEEPKESYAFKYDKTEMQGIFKKVSMPFIRRGAIYLLACVVVCVLLPMSNVNHIIIGLFYGCSLIGMVSYIKGYFSYKKAWTVSEKRVIASEYTYEIFEWYFVIKIYRNQEVKSTQKVYFNDVEKIQTFGNYLFLSILGQSYIIKKESLKQDSIFNTLFNRAIEKTDNKKLNGVLKAVSNILFVASILTIYGSLIAIGILSGINHGTTDNLWVCFLFLPIPIISIIFGFHLKKKGYKYKKNVIVGVIMAILLCIYGSFTFIFANVYSHSDEPILKAEETLNIDIPEHSRIDTMDWTEGTQSVPRGYIYSESEIYFEDSDVEEFEKNLKNDNKWINNIPNDMVGITSHFCDYQKNAYFIIYNKDTKEFNKLPDHNGKYQFINVIYNPESDEMTLVEYEIEYAK